MQTTIKLAKDLEISRVVTGLWQIADMERHGNTLDPVATAKFMKPYVDAGLTSFDMADHYGSSEIITGTFKNSLADKNSVQLFTKWVPKPGKITRDDVRAAIQTALDRMQQSSIDLLQFHAWYYPDASWLDGLFYLKELQEEGLIKYIGVTNFDAAHLRIALASGIPIISNQICHSLIDQRANGNMAAVCQEYNVKLLAFGTLAGGFLTDKWLNKTEPTYEELTTWSQMKYKRFIDAAGGWEPYQNLLQTVKKIADKHQASIANIASRFILEGDAVASVIVGARLGESEHIYDNRKMLDITLDADDINAIKEAQLQLTLIPGDCGDEYRKPPFLTASGDLSDHLETIPKAFTPLKTGENREQIFSGTEWEEYAGYCRAVKIGNSIHVSGTTATHGSDMIGGTDPAAQAHFIIDKIEGVITSFGGTLADVVRTRIFVNELKDWEPVARAHGERFKGINPANTLVEAKLVGEGYMVEIEAEAILS
ncbi:aryl-alcohol dehydrogenase-like predicted oxidoreductase [Maribacter spongiicola]|uniref:Aryl-alcohol dehydrogenase-like predicted oxidoreductase n=1 Tax=Maribacter spongiicola TaxID=1206753 RepID=A0A4R7JYX5_9FLAO|nr:aldo/keto reductase [Maribacter spongiicola]TDT43731.1 aryl-alcohol dehydrogenase-like predicted oxidoreductase [Maribacter spongiicola]